MQRAKDWAWIVLLTLLLGLANSAQAADDTARFYGTWRATFPYNGRSMTMVSVHSANGFANYIVVPTGYTPAGNGTFSAANGRYVTSDVAPNNSGTYRFINNDEIIATNAAGQTSTWRREKTAQPQAQQQAQARQQPQQQVAQQRAAPAATQPHTTADDLSPEFLPETNAAITAINRRDYNTAWRDFMIAAQKGDSEAEAGVGSMLLRHVNPPGTGYYAQAEKWLLASANQGNAKGMTFLATYYYDSGVAVAGGINPGINTAPIPPALKQQAEQRFALAREWYERAAAKNDGYAIGKLAIMLDAGVGGPADPNRAAQLREQLKHPNNLSYTDPAYVKKATADPGNLSMATSWQSGHYAEALQNAQARAAQGDANAEALLGRAYYEGVGVNRSYSTALYWLNKAVAQNNADAMFILGLMYEWGRGVNQDLKKALSLLDRSAALGQPMADIEAGGMRMQGEAAAQAARYAAQCRSRGGYISDDGCMRGGYRIDPY
jgi:TPR repeat protein